MFSVFILSALLSSAFVIGCRLSSVCVTYTMTRVYCDKTANRITAKQLRVSTVSKVSFSFKTKFEGVPLICRFNLCWGGLGLCQTVVIADYILTHDVTLLSDSQSQLSL